MKNSKGIPKVVFVLGGVVVLFVILWSLGIFKFNVSVRKSLPETTAPQQTVRTKAEEVTPTPQSQLTPQAVDFSVAGGKVNVSMRIPLGWVKGNSPKAEFIVGSPTPEKLSSGQTFTVNINAIGGPHEAGFKTFSDYQASWKDSMLKQYPSLQFLSDTTTNIDGMDTYVLEVTNALPDGTRLHQVQYLFYVDDKTAFAVTGTVPDAFWNKYADVIKLSIESIKKTSTESQ